MQSSITPAILEQRFESVASKMKAVSTLVKVVQIDICDGSFVPSRTYGSTARLTSIKRIKKIAKKNKLSLEVDLMVDLDCGNCMEQWAQALLVLKPTRVIFHLGSTYRWEELFQHLQHRTKNKQLPFECGLAIRVDHTRREIRKIYDEHPFSFIQIMGIKKVGYSGQKLSPLIYDRIKKIRRMYSDIDIAIDGGVKPVHAPKLFASGATRLGMNSGLFSTPDIKAVIENLDHL